MKCVSVSQRENVQHWALKLKSALAAAVTWGLKGCMVQVKEVFL